MTEIEKHYTVGAGSACGVQCTRPRIYVCGDYKEGEQQSEFIEGKMMEITLL